MAGGVGVSGPAATGAVHPRDRLAARIAATTTTRVTRDRNEPARAFDVVEAPGRSIGTVERR
jgi:hypothetical protein